MTPIDTEGSLAVHDVPSLVQSLHEARWTGRLTVTSAGVGKSVIVQDGGLVFASSSSPDDRLGELLLAQGRLTLQHYIEGSRAVAPGKRLGTVLVEMGALTPKDLVRAVVEQTREIIYSLFLLTEGQYRLQPGPPSKEAIKLNLRTPDLIMEGIRRIRAWSRIDRAIGGAEAVYTRRPGYEQPFSRMSLDPETRALMAGFDRPRSVSALCAGSTLPDFAVCQAVWAFRVIGILVPVPGDGAAENERKEHDDEGLAAILGEPEA